MTKIEQASPHQLYSPERIRRLGNAAAAIHDPRITKQVTWALYSGLYGVLYHMDPEADSTAKLGWSHSYANSLLIHAHTAAQLHLPRSPYYRNHHFTELFTGTRMFTALIDRMDSLDAARPVGMDLQIFNSTMIDGYARVAQDEQATEFVRSRSFELYMTANLAEISQLLEAVTHKS